MSGRRVLALYAALLFGFAGVLCRLFYLASRTDYAARAAAQSTVTLELPARRGGFYDCMGLPLTGLEKRWLALCFPGQENYTRLYACTDTAGQELLYRSRSRAAPFLVEVDRDMTALGIPCYAASRRYAAAPLCPQLLGYLDGEGHGAAGLEKALDALLTGSGARDTLLCPVTAQGTLRTGEQVQHLQADSGAVGVRLTLSRSVQRAAEAVAAQTMTTGCILVLDVRTAALRACVSVPVDEVTKAYLKGRSQREPVYYEADPDAEYEKTIEIDLSALEPTVSYPHLPENTHLASEGKEIKIDQVVIGSCTNGRLEDMEAAYNVLKGKHIAKGVRGIIIPATMAVYKECILRGWTTAFIDAGCIVSTPTCGPCLGGYMGILAEGERCVSTTNRNFVGRMGHVKSEVYLASPATAAASALTGYITDPRTV